MAGRIYLAIGLSFLVDWLLLMGVGRLNGERVSLLRTMFGALLGGIYTWLCLSPRFIFLGSIIWRLIILFSAGLLAYDISINKAVQFVLAELALYGMTAGNASAPHLCMAAVILVVLLLIAFRGKTGPQSVAVKICHNGKTAEFRALCDSGNLLRDPITGSPVLVVSADLSESLIGLKADMLHDPLSCLNKGSGLRLVPYHTVGGSGFLIAKRFESVSVNGKVEPRIVAFSPNEIGAGKQFCAITGGI